jgi:hypothetical protein
MSIYCSFIYIYENQVSCTSLQMGNFFGYTWFQNCDSYFNSIMTKLIVESKLLAWNGEHCPFWLTWTLGVCIMIKKTRNPIKLNTRWFVWISPRQNWTNKMHMLCQIVKKCLVFLNLSNNIVALNEQNTCTNFISTMYAFCVIVALFDCDYGNKTTIY